MLERFDLILQGATVVNHDGLIIRDIGIKNGKIAYLGNLATAHSAETIDCKGLHILPGVIDSQVHFREPGLEHKENLVSGSISAVLGGVTSVFEMPNTNPNTISEDALADKVKRAHHNMYCDFAFWVGGTHENADYVDELERLPGAAGIKVFMGSSTGSLLVADDEGIARILSKINRRAAFHAEDEFLLEERKNLRVRGDVNSHPIWRDSHVALNCTKRLVGLAQEYGAKIHILHISTKEEIAFLADYKNLVTCEVTPHHLTLDASQYNELGSLIQMNPPIRSRDHLLGLWKGVEQGIIDVLGSDHAPHTKEEKAKTYPDSPSGMTGVQTLLPIMLDHVANGKLSLLRLVDLTSYSPSRIFGISGKGRIAVGYDADFSIVDLNKKFIISNDTTASKAGWTPYDGKKVQGCPVGTIVRGKKVMWEGQLIGAASGEAIKFIDSYKKLPS